MAKGFKVPSFSVPKVSIPTTVTVKVPDVNLDKIPGGSNIKNLAGQVDIPEMGDLKKSLGEMGINSINDAKNMLFEDGKIEIKIPTITDLKDAAASKLDTAKTVIQTTKEQGLKEGLKSAIPQDYKNLAQTVDVSSLKEKLKGGN